MKTVLVKENFGLTNVTISLKMETLTRKRGYPTFDSVIGRLFKVWHEYFYKSEVCRSSTNMTKLISEQIKLKFAQSRNQYDLNLSLLSAKVS